MNSTTYGTCHGTTYGKGCGSSMATHWRSQTQTQTQFSISHLGLSWEMETKSKSSPTYRASLSRLDLEMLNQTEIDRLAAAAHALRPDWPIRSLATFIERDHAARPYRDVAVALAWVAVDPKTVTPKRMNELGPWWTALASTENTSPTHFERCPETGHRSFPAHNCSACRADQLAGGAA